MLDLLRARLNPQTSDTPSSSDPFGATTTQLLSERARLEEDIQRAYDECKAMTEAAEEDLARCESTYQQDQQRLSLAQKHNQQLQQRVDTGLELLQHMLPESSFRAMMAARSPHSKPVKPSALNNLAGNALRGVITQPTKLADAR
uniref:Uncharacterized protein n=1 Tax=Mycena chlorophos TaxID=658473 RepID=A0ABQ0MCC8_MYCCL|nr:predicted protein [Mycena chlorophos]